MIVQTMDRFTIRKRLYKGDCINILKSYTQDELKYIKSVQKEYKQKYRSATKNVSVFGALIVPAFVFWN